MSTEAQMPLSEHQAPTTTESSPVGYQPTEEEEKAIKLADRLFKKNQNARKAYDEKWLDYYRMFRGKQWKEQRPSYRHSEVINLIFRAIQSEVPILTDAMPRPEFLPTEPNDYELSKILNDVLESDWQHNNWSYKFTEMLYDMHIYGTGFGCVSYDADICDGIGGVVFKSGDPFYQFPDPYAKDVNEDANSYVEVEPIDVERIKSEYPKVAEWIKPDLLDLDRKEKGLSENVRYKSPTDNRTVMEGSSTYDLEARNEVLKIICYVKDLSTVQEEVQEPGEGGLTITKTITKLRYPNGRKIITANGVLCEDRAIEYDDGQFPYFKASNYILPREFYGMSEIEQLESPQRIFNKLVSFSLDVLTLMGNPIWIVDSTSGVDTDNLINRPGIVIEKDPDGEVRREEGVHLQPYVLEMINMMKSWFDDISGSNDVSRGVKPQGVTAASAIEALQDASQTRLRQKSRNIDASVQNFGQLYLSRVFQFYDVPRIFRITNDQNVTRYFKFHVDTVDEIDPLTQLPTGNKKKVARVRPYSQGDNGAYFADPEKQYEIRRKFDVKVSTGSALPFEKQRVEEQSFNLFDRKIIDGEEVMKNLKYPNYQAVVKRMADKAAADAAQAAQAEAMKAKGGAPPLPPI